MSEKYMTKHKLSEMRKTLLSQSMHTKWQSAIVRDQHCPIKSQFPLKPRINISNILVSFSAERLKYYSAYLHSNKLKATKRYC